MRARRAWSGTRRFRLWPSLAIALLAIAASLTGILIDTIYADETDNRRAQSVAQDIANLGAYSALLILAALALRGSLPA